MGRKIVSLLRHWKDRLKSRLSESVRDRPSVGDSGADCKLQLLCSAASARTRLSLMRRLRQSLSGSRKIGARNKRLPARLQADLPLYGRGMMVKNSRITLSSALLEPRKGTPSPRLEEAEFRRRFLNRFQDPAFDSLRSELDKVASAAWDAYEHQRKAPRTQKAGGPIQGSGVRAFHRLACSA